MDRASTLQASSVMPSQTGSERTALSCQIRRAMERGPVMVSATPSALAAGQLDEHLLEGDARAATVLDTELPAEQRPAANLVFLLDVSGSMNSADKLPLLKKSFRLLTRKLNADDRVSIVVYAGASGVVLDPTPGDHRRQKRAFEGHHQPGRRQRQPEAEDGFLGSLRGDRVWHSGSEGFG